MTIFADHPDPNGLVRVNKQKIMMINPVSGIRDPESVKNIIFDFGGVICPIDPQITILKFKEFGPPKPGRERSPEETAREFGLLVGELETGRISPEQFRQAIRDFYLHPLSDEQIDDAWNALLLEIPAPRIHLLEKLRQHYRIFLLSNSNRIHYDCYAERFRREFGYPGFDALFEKAWFSFRIGLSKPGREIFEYVLADGAISPRETLFIDDTQIHVNGAELTGIQGYHLKDGQDILALFRE